MGYANQSCPISRVCVRVCVTLWRCKKCLSKPNLPTHTQTNTPSEESRRAVKARLWVKQSRANICDGGRVSHFPRLPSISRFSDLFPPFLTFSPLKRRLHLGVVMATNTCGELMQRGEFKCRTYIAVNMLSGFSAHLSESSCWKEKRGKAGKVEEKRQKGSKVNGKSVCPKLWLTKKRSKRRRSAKRRRQGVQDKNANTSRTLENFM